MLARALAVLALATTLVWVAPASGQPLRTTGNELAQFDLWTGIWAEATAPQRKLVLRQLPSGELRGIFWNTNATPPAAETLDPEYLDIDGYASLDGSRLAAAMMAIPGGLVPVQLDLETSRYPWELFLVPEGATTWTHYIYVGGGENRALLELGRTWDPYRNGQVVDDAVRRGDRVRVTFELDGLGPRAVAEDVVLLTVLVPRKVGKSRIGNVSPLGRRCAKAKRPSHWRVTCWYAHIQAQQRVVHVDIGVPRSFTARHLTLLYELALRKGWKARSGLEQIWISGVESDGTLKIRVLPPVPPGGGTGGGGGGGGTGTTRQFTDPTGTVTVPGAGRTGSGRILFPQAIIRPQTAADEYCKRVDDVGHYTMAGTSGFQKATAFEAEPGGSGLAVGLLLWEIVQDPIEVFASITCST